MNTEHLNYLLAVADSRSINQAAAKLHLQRPYLSKIIQALEQQLGIVLFQRDNKGITLTEEGQYAVGQIRQAMAILNDLEQHFHPTATAVFPQYREQLTILIPDLVRPRNHLLEIVTAFGHRFPNVQLNLKEHSIQQTIEEVQRNPDSIGITARCRHVRQLNRPLPEDCTFIPVHNTHLVALAGLSHPTAQKYQTISLITLLKQKLVLFDSLGNENSFFSQLISEHNKESLKYVVSGNITLYYQLLEQQEYFSLGAYTNTETRLLQIPLRENIKITFGLLHHQQMQNSFVGRAFIQQTLEALQKKL